MIMAGILQPSIIPHKPGREKGLNLVPTRCVDLVPLITGRTADEWACPLGPRRRVLTREENASTG
jgi:hypothetical protein